MMKVLWAVILVLPLLLFSQSFERGEKLFLEGKWRQAQPLLEHYLKDNPSDYKTLEYLGDISSYDKNWNAALAYYKRLKILEPQEADYVFKYGAALGMKVSEGNKLQALGMIGELRSSFEKAIQLDPRHLGARWALIELYLKLPGILGGSEAKAIKYSAELQGISEVDGYLSRGHIEEYFNRYNSAEQQYKRAIQIGRSKVCYQKLADLYSRKMKQPAKADKLWEEYNRLKMKI